MLIGHLPIGASQVVRFRFKIACHQGAFTIKGQKRLHRPLKVDLPFIAHFFKFGMQIAYWQPFSVYFMAYTKKGQTKAAAAFKGILAIYWLILFKFGLQIGYRQPFSVCFMSFTIKGQTKAADAFKGILAIYSLILLNWECG